MRRLAKAPSAFTFGRSSGRIAAFAFAMTCVLLLANATGASATKYYDSNFGTTSGTASSAVPPTPSGTAFGGFFGSANGGAGDIAVNDPETTTDGTGQSGWIYVSDRGNNRIQAFDSNKAFKWAIGRDVIAPSVSEVQILEVKATSGKFKLKLDALETAVDIDWNTSAATLDTRVGELVGGAANVVVTGTPATATTAGYYAIQFSGTANQNQITDQPGSPALVGTASVSTLADGTASVPGDLGDAFEKCTVAAHCKAGSVGTLTDGPGGEFNIATGIDLDQATGDLFVRERATSTSSGGAGNRRVQQFTGAGAFVRAFGWDVTASGPGNTGGFETCNAAAADVCQAATAAGTAPGQFNNNTANINGIAVAPPGAPNAGVVYAADPGDTATRRILPFTVPAGPTAAVVAGTPFGSSNGSSNVTFPSNDEQFAADLPGDVAVGLDGIVYASNRQSGNGYVNRYDPSSASFLPRIRFDVIVTRIRGLEVDRSTGHLLVARESSSVLELELTGIPLTVEPSDVIDSHAAGLGVFSSSSPGGLAVGAGRMLLSSGASVAFTGSGQRLLVLDDSGIDPAPIVDVDPAEDVEATSATLIADVDPNRSPAAGFPTLYRFQVSLDGVTWENVTANALVGGDGFTPAAVSASATGLRPNSLYRYRVRTQRDPAAGVSVSTPQLFLTEPAAPLVETIAAQQVADTSAMLVGRLNPGGLSATYWFEWGEDIGYGKTAPDPAATTSGSVPKLVGETLASLAPAAEYHFRLCAQNALTPTKVCGPDRTFTTRASAAAPDGRTYEMVTPPDKALRRGGATSAVPDYWARLQTGLPSPAGDAVNWSLFAGVTDAEAGHGMTLDFSNEVRRRQAGVGWRGEAVLNTQVYTGATAPVTGPNGFSADLDTQAWVHAAPNLPFPSAGKGSRLSTRVLGDSGGPLAAGWYPWIDPAWVFGSGGDPPYFLSDGVIVDDTGERMLRMGAPAEGQSYRDLIPADDTVSPSQLSPPQTAGSAIFLSGPEGGWRPDDLVSECSGAPGGGEETQLLTRAGASLAATNTIGARPCGEGSTTSVRGAYAKSPFATAMSDGGDRVFFLSPDPNTSVTGTGGNGQTACNDQFLSGASLVPALGADTQCPPQLFVRQYDDDGDPTVRWISRAEDALFDAPADGGIGPQRIGEVGRGVKFVGAARDGSVVYFSTNAPLLTDDPNGGSDRVNGLASDSSWDLYRYELGPDNDADPGAGDPGDRLARVSGGPAAPAGDPSATDPSTNLASGEGGVVRFMSDDGNRVYFVTTSRIGAGASAWNSSPLGGTTTPSGSVGNGIERNLYLYDATKSGAAAYRFIARLPFSITGIDNGDLSTCASSGTRAEASVHMHGRNGRSALIMNSNSNCVRGTTSGDAILFETTGRLTADDVDDAGDVYLYDADTNAITRLSAPPPGSAPYPCLHDFSSTALLLSCNGTLGTAPTGANWVSASGGSVGNAGLRNFNLSETADGSLEAAYFESLLPLVAADENDGMDVYEWRRGDGRLSLVSPGAPGQRAFYSGNSRDGRDVFFWTEQRISPWEIDASDGDLYDATQRPDRLPDPPPPVPLCGVLAGACQGASGPAPPPSSAASSALAGAGNVVDKRPRGCAKGKVRRGGKCVAKKKKSAKKKPNRTANKTRRAHR